MSWQLNLPAISQRLKDLRFNSNRSLEQVSYDLQANGIPIGTTSIWKYENNQIKQLNISIIAAFAKYYNVSERYILYGELVTDYNTNQRIVEAQLHIIQQVAALKDIEALESIIQHINEIKKTQSKVYNPD